MNTRGFTLVELVVALVISGFLAGVVFQLVRGQERFVSMQSAREEVQQNGRAALELISAELRGASREGITHAEERVIRFRMPRIFGLVCAAPASGTRAVVFPGLDLTAFRSGTDSIAVRDSTSTADPRWRFAGVTDATPSGGQGAAQCGGFSPDAGRVQVRTFTGLQDAAIPFQLGEPAYLYDAIEYDAGPSNVPGEWLRRQDRGGTQPLAGPLAVRNEVPVFRLRYYGDNGSLLPMPITNLAAIAEVEVMVATRSRSDKVPLEFRDSTRVRLRN